jgi:predicted transcriptional regulator
VTPAEVREALTDDLAYTTVMTILTRLWEKGLAEREQQGRSYAYRPAMSEAELTATRMREMLATASNRKAALSSFVDSLSKRDATALRAMLRDLGGQ